MDNVESGIYIHIPYCRSKCFYCSFVSDTDFSDVGQYIDAVIAEIGERGGGRIDSIYIGGGTPSILPRGEIARLLSAVRANFDVCGDCEISIECNPDSADEDFFRECAAAGVNRVSIGLQSACDALLKNAGRVHTFGQFEDCYLIARRCGMKNVNVDLMLALPGQTVRNAEESVEKVISLGAEHISVYGLSVEEGTLLDKSGYRPDEDVCAEMYERCCEVLKRSGYERYEVSNFALGGKRCRHNMKYWTDAPYFGFGAAAHSYDGVQRTANTSDRKKYIKGERVEMRSVLTRDDKTEERIMLSLRTADGLDLKKFFSDFGYSLEAAKEKQLSELVKSGMVEIGNGCLRLTEKAYYVMNGIIVSII